MPQSPSEGARAAAAAAQERSLAARRNRSFADAKEAGAAPPPRGLRQGGRPTSSHRRRGRGAREESGRVGGGLCVDRTIGGDQRGEELQVHPAAAAWTELAAHRPMLRCASGSNQRRSGGSHRVGQKENIGSVIGEIGRGEEGTELATVGLAESDQESNRSSDDRCSRSQKRTRITLESIQEVLPSVKEVL
jgi:hypothetical protein